MAFRKLLAHLRETASHSTCAICHAAAVTKGGKILASEANDGTRSSCHGMLVSSICAELATVLAMVPRHLANIVLRLSRLRRVRQGATNPIRQIFRRCKMIVIRVNRSGDYGSSHPCNDCVRLLQGIGLLRITYSDGEDVFVTERVEDLEMVHVRSGKLSALESKALRC